MLSLSATPIPRTLHMSLAGLRDISVIATPPRDRKPIRTHVGEWDEELVRPGHPARARARGPDVLPAQPRRDDRRGGREAAPAGARGARRRRPRPDGATGSSRRSCSSSCAATTTCSCSTTIIESGLDIPQANTLDRRARRPARPGPALPDPRTRRPERASPPTPTSCTRTAASSARGARAPRDARRLHRARLGLPRSPCATSSCAAPATCSATSSRATSPPSASSSTARCSPRPCAELGGAGALPVARPVRVDAQRRRLRAGDLRPARGGQDRRPPPHRAGPELGTSCASCWSSSPTASARCPGRSRTWC